MMIIMRPMIYLTQGMNVQTIVGPQGEHDDDIVVSSGDTVTVKLTTDGNTAATEEFFVNVIAGRDAGVWLHLLRIGI